MARRTCVLVLAMALTVAPVILTVCQLACAEATAQPSTTHATATHGRTCHHAAAEPGARASQAPRGCEHGVAHSTVPSLAAARDVDLAVPLAISVATTALAPVHTAAFRVAAIPRALECGDSPEVIPLRI